MKPIRKYLIIVLTLVLTLSMTMTVYGASGKKPIYLLTKYKYSDSETSSTVKYTYNKYGLLKGVRYSDSENGIIKGTFIYNNNKATELRYKCYHGDFKRYDGCIKYNYDKNGNVSRIRDYMVENGKYDLFYEIKLTWNKKGQLTKYKLQSPDEEDITESYKYNQKGQLRKYIYTNSDNTKTIKTYKYNKAGKYIKGYSDDYYEECTYDGNKRTLIQYKDKSKRNAITKIRQTYDHGNLIKETVRDCDYDANDPYDVDYSWTNSYKFEKNKLSSKYLKLAKKQQASLSYMASWGS